MRWLGARRGIPEGTIARCLSQYRHKLRPEPCTRGYVGTTEALSDKRGTHDRHHLFQRQEAALRVLRNTRPVSRVGFRPEEIETTSRVREFPPPIAKGNINVPVDGGRTRTLNDTVANYQARDVAAVQTGGLDGWLSLFPERARRRPVTPSRTGRTISAAHPQRCGTA